jgi:hypothetical protein
MKKLLYRWPSAAKVGRIVPKNKLYEHATVSTVLREMFVSEVQRITWAYKLAEATINLSGTTAVPEIQVFQIDTKGDNVSQHILTAIDKAVKTPIIFEITRADDPERRTRMTATPKLLGSGRPKLGVYYTTDWQVGSADRQPLPIAISLPALYTALLKPLTPMAARPGEELSEAAARLETVRKLEREVAALEQKIRTEPQLNRKVELRRMLRMKQATLADLTNPTLHPPTDPEI